MNAITKFIATDAAKISYKQDQNLRVDEFKIGIVASWKKVASSIVETARLLLEAEQQLDRAGFTAIRKHLADNGIMSETVISKLLTIARNAVLSAPDNVPLLPGSYATLYVLARKDPAEVQSALTDGRISPLTQLKDLTDLFPEVSGKGQKVSPAKDIVVVVQNDLSNVPADKVLALKEALDALKEFVSVQVKGLRV